MKLAVLAAVVLAAHTASAAGVCLSATEQAVLAGPFASDGAGGLVFYDAQRTQLRRLDAATGLIHPMANAADPFDGLGYPRDLALDATDRVFVASRIVRRVDPDGQVTDVAGNGEASFCGDGMTALETCMDAIDVVVDAAGNLFIADAVGKRVRRVDVTTELVTTVAGNGSPVFCGDGGPATAACIDPEQLALDGAGNVYVLDRSNLRVHRIDAATGTITTVAGYGTSYQCGGTLGNVCIATHIGLDEEGRILLSVIEPFHSRSAWVQRIDPDMQLIENIGQFTCPPVPNSGGCPAIGAVAADGRGGAYVFRSDHRDGPRVVRVDLATGIETVVAGNGAHQPCGGGGNSIDCHLFALEQATPCAPGATTARLSAILRRGGGRVRALLACSTGSRAASREARRIVSHMALAARESRGTTKACRSSLRATARALRRSLAAD